MRIKANANTEYLKELLSDPAALADQVLGWRASTGYTQSEAAYFLDLPMRTLQGIEQGRGFRYPTILWNAMRNVHKDLEEASQYSPEQMKVAIADTVKAARMVKEMRDAKN